MYRFITEAKFPFRIIHANAGFFKLAQDESSTILGKPLCNLSNDSILGSFLQSLKGNAKLTENLKSQDVVSFEQMFKGTQIAGILPKCFIKLFLVGSDTDCNRCEEKDDTIQVTHFLTQIETNSLSIPNMSIEGAEAKNLPTRAIG